MTFASLGASGDSGAVIRFRGPDANEQLIGFLFVHSWAMHSGHPVPGRSPDLLSAQELVDFWADDGMQH